MLTRTGKFVFASTAFFVLASILCIGGMLTFWSMIGPDPADYPPATYAVADVASVCALFEVDTSDPFCASPANNDPFDLEAMLERRFPPGITTWAQLAPYLHTLFISGLDVCQATPGWETNIDCQPETKCTGQGSCMFRMPHTIYSLTVVFDNEGQVRRYGALLLTEEYGAFPD